jgi:protein-arginine kinase activator protein McsA
MNEGNHLPIAASDIIASIHHCEVCHNKHAKIALIAVTSITYLEWERDYPWYICRNCATKISDALKAGKRE